MAGNSSLTMFKYSPSEVLIFEGEHYDYWYSEMRDFFISHDLWEAIEQSYEEPPENGSSTAWTEAQQKEFKENQKKDCTALRYIKQGVSKSIYPRIFNKKGQKISGKFCKKNFKGTTRLFP